MPEAVGQIGRGVARESSCFLIRHVVGSEVQIVVNQLTRLRRKGGGRTLRTIWTIWILLVCHYRCNGRQVCECVCVWSMEEKRKRGSWGGEEYIFIGGEGCPCEGGLGRKMNKKADEYKKRKNEYLQKTNL